MDHWAMGELYRLTLFLFHENVSANLHHQKVKRRVLSGENAFRDTKL